MSLPSANRIANNWINNPVITRRAKDSILSLESEIRRVSQETTNIAIDIPYNFEDIIDNNTTAETAGSIYLFLIIKHFRAKGYVIRFNKPDYDRFTITARVSWNPVKGNKFLEYVRNFTEEYIDE